MIHCKTTFKPSICVRNVLINSGNAMPTTKPAPRNPKPLLKATPSRTRIASKAPAQIIWPAHVKVQHITLPPPSDSTRICTGSVRGHYRTGQGLSGYQAL